MTSFPVFDKLTSSYSVFKGFKLIAQKITTAVPAPPYIWHSTVSIKWELLQAWNVWKPPTKEWEPKDWLSLVKYCMLVVELGWNLTAQYSQLFQWQPMLRLPQNLTKFFSWLSSRFLFWKNLFRFICHLWNCIPALKKKMFFFTSPKWSFHFPEYNFFKL